MIGPIDKIIKYLLKYVQEAGKTVSEFAYTSMVNAGAIAPGQVVPKGTDLDSFIQQVLLTVFNPTLNAPSLNTSLSIGYSDREIGELISFSISASFSRGSILGLLENGVWNANAYQNPRSGAALNYIIHGTNTDLFNSLNISDYQVVLGNNTFSALANYSEGPQPLKSNGAPFSTPLAAGSASNSKTIVGKRKTFFGASFTGYTSVTSQYNCVTFPPVPHIAIWGYYGDLTSLFPIGCTIKVTQNNNEVKYTTVQNCIYTTITGQTGYWTLIIPTEFTYSDAWNVTRVAPYYIPQTSADIRSLSGSALGLTNGSQFNINIPAGSTIVAFAYPETLGEVSSVIYIEAFNSEVKQLFGIPSGISVYGANNYSSAIYRLYYMIPDAPFPQSATYKVTI